MQEREKEMSAVNGLMGLHSHLTKKKGKHSCPLKDLLHSSHCLTLLPELSAPLSPSRSLPQSGLWHDT